MTTYSINQIETAINYYRDQKPDSISLGPEARALGDVYGMMIYTKSDSITSDGLTDSQKQALVNALDKSEKSDT